MSFPWAYPTAIYTVLALLAFPILIILLRLPVLFHAVPPVPLRRPPPPTTRILIILGSGGHTAEMLSLFSHPLLPTPSYPYRSYLVASDDTLSAQRAHAFEVELAAHAAAHNITYGAYDVLCVRRARRIHEPLWKAGWGAICCFVGCMRALARPSPESILLATTAAGKSNDRGAFFPRAVVGNGPGTAVMVFAAVAALKVLGWSGSWRTRCIYIESWARVRGLSLSGRIVVALGLCQRVVVQWEGAGGPGREVKGCLVR